MAWRRCTRQPHHHRLPPDYCISMEAMRQEGVNEILTNDNHFKQEGFTILL
jgi:predicted nucleic acid-binding protein